MFYYHMNQKPVAQSVLWHVMPKIMAVYGLLSLCVTAIVVNYFILVSLRLANEQRDVHRVYTLLK
ncbi:acid stress response protein YqgB [Kosakonia cowanii]|uniref:acid stress response protein YqgB n=1 Tax=Kosakonia cowanii TaxID=208223 RepID=UPI003A4E5713